VNRTQAIYWVLICFYVLLFASESYDRNWSKSVYWVGALILTFALMKMK
jgi:hypothetical protein